MTDIVNTFLEEHIYRFALIITLCMGAMIFAMGVDLIFGIQKAKANGEATTSTGLKKTCDKARKYFSPFLVAVSIDLIAACAGVSCPVFAMLWTAYCLFCEFVSVREKSWKKAEIRKQERTMRVLIENKDDIAKLIMEMLSQRINDEKEEEEDEKNGNG